MQIKDFIPFQDTLHHWKDRWMPISSYFENQLKKLSLQKWLIESGNDSKEMTPEKIHQITILERKIEKIKDLFFDLLK